MQARKTVQGKIVEKKIVCRTDEQIKLVQKLVKENCSSVRGLIQTMQNFTEPLHTLLALLKVDLETDRSKLTAFQNILLVTI